ncbi:MAG TPA: hypothetical protein VII13_16110, partial [Vicinamibacteria bacterium]
MDVGPSTGAYGAGFSDSEERPPTTFRWTQAQAALDLPVVASSGPATVTLRAARYVHEPARIHVAVNGQPAGAFVARPGGNRVYALPATVPEGRVRVDLLGDDPRLGVALDWVRLEGVRFSIPWSNVGARVLPAGAAGVLLLGGFGAPVALAGGALVLVAEAAWAAHDPFACAHVTARVGLPALALAAGVAFFLRRFPGGRWVAAAFLLSHLLKGAALFHPSYFYNDVRNNRRYVAALATGEAPLAERNVAAQTAIGVAYPRVIAGRKYAFPYSPVFFLPFGWLPPERVVEAMKHVAVAATAAETIVVFFLARALGSRGVLAAALAAVLPILHSRILLAMWSTVAGHLLDGAVILSALHLTAAPAAWLRHAGLVLLAFLTYISSLFNLGLFTTLQGLLQRKRALRLFGILAAAGAFTVAWLYAPFVVLFVTEILPGLGQGGVGGGDMPETGLLPALRRWVIFYGPAIPILAAGGFALLWRRTVPERRPILGAYALAVLVLVALRGFTGGLFKDLKEIEFAAPLV